LIANDSPIQTDAEGELLIELGDVTTILGLHPQGLSVSSIPGEAWHELQDRSQAHQGRRSGAGIRPTSRTSFYGLSILPVINRLEVDSANAARTFLQQHGIPEDDIDLRSRIQVHCNDPGHHHG
jgi:hypothetical protein